MKRKKILILAVGLSIVGVLIIALPLSILNGRDLHEALSLLAGIEVPILWLALWDVFCSHLRQRSIPMHIGSVTRMIEMKGK